MKQLPTIGVSTKQASDAWMKLIHAALGGGRREPLPTFFKVETRVGAFVITWYDPERQDQMMEWFGVYGAKPETVNGYGWHLFTDDDELALLAKLTWGGV